MLTRPLFRELSFRKKLTNEMIAASDEWYRPSMKPTKCLLFKIPLRLIGFFANILITQLSCHFYVYFICNYLLGEAVSQIEKKLCNVIVQLSVRSYKDTYSMNIKWILKCCWNMCRRIINKVLICVSLFILHLTSIVVDATWNTFCLWYLKMKLP